MKRILPTIIATVSLGVSLGVANGADSPKAGAIQGATNAAAAKSLTVANFEQGVLQTKQGLSWDTFTDSALGGKSSIKPSLIKEGAGGSKGALQLSGNLTADFQWGGFAGVRALLLPGGSSTNLSEFKGVQFYARGDGKTYRVLLGKESVQDSNHFSAEFPTTAEWKLVQIPFSRLAQSPYFGKQISWSAGDITAIGFMAQSAPGEESRVKLELDDPGFFR